MEWITVSVSFRFANVFVIPCVINWKMLAGRRETENEVEGYGILFTLMLFRNHSNCQCHPYQCPNHCHMTAANRNRHWSLDLDPDHHLHVSTFSFGFEWIERNRTTQNVSATNAIKNVCKSINGRFESRHYALLVLDCQFQRYTNFYHQSPIFLVSRQVFIVRATLFVILRLLT